MMGTSLQVPLAALIAMMKLTHSPQIIMPGMLVIVVAGLTASELFRRESLFVTMLKAGGLMRAVGLARHLQGAEQKNGELGKTDLIAIPARGFNVTSINLQAMLQEAMEMLKSGAAEALYV